jgi:hypothetical protein
MKTWLLLSLVAMGVGWGIAAPAGPAVAGGWAVVSFDTSPEVVAGTPTELGFTLLRHGVTPESSSDVTFVVAGPDGYRERFAAVPSGGAGHHVVTITVPADGDYTWTVEGSFMPIDLGALTVAPDGSGSAGGGSSVGWDVVQWGGSGLAVLLAAAAVVDATASRRRRPEGSVATGT